MSEAETETAKSEILDAVQEAQEVQEVIEAQEAPVEQKEDKQVPLSALQRERKKRQEAEQRASYLEQQQQQAAQKPQDDETAYESVTKKELKETTYSFKQELKREIAEEDWIKENPEKFEKLNDELPQLLKQRPNLAAAISTSVNRYEEAWELISAFSKKPSLPVSAKKPDRPGSPMGIPKAAAINQTMDVMQMSDDEFAKWRASKRSKR